MKLSKLYSNDKRFKEITFKPGLNVVLASVADHTDSSKDTHNLGKSTLSHIIDFCFLATLKKNSFLHSRADLFGQFEFFLEIMTNSKVFVTVKRTVENPTKICIKKHQLPDQDFRLFTDKDWDHFETPIDRAKTILDSFFTLEMLSNWSFRNAIGYSLRSQSDYGDVFQLQKFKGSHSDWKPLLAHLIGLNGELVEKKFQIESELEALKKKEISLRLDLQGASENPDLLEGLIISKSDDIQRFEEDLNSYNFKVTEKEVNKDLINRIETSIATLNNRRYSLEMSNSRISAALNEKISFNLNRIESLFAEVKIHFPIDLKKNYQELLSFNKALSTEREMILKKELKENESELFLIEEEIGNLSKERSLALSALREMETFEKYKQLSRQLVSMKTDLEKLERQKEAFKKIKEVSRMIRAFQNQIAKIVDDLQEEIDSNKSHYFQIRRIFHAIIRKIINQNATLYTKINSSGNIDFAAQITDESGNDTSQDSGFSYRKLLCVAFDLSLIREYLKEDYIRFVYHDGIFESLDDRKKFNLIELIREYSQAGIQHIVTCIDSDLPILEGTERFRFKEDEVVLKLHDQGDDGRLFMMPEW